MDAGDSEQFLRQQLSYARILVARLEAEPSIPVQRALRQSAVLCFELGLSQYFSNTFNLPAADLQSLKRCLAEGAEGFSESIPSSEFIDLMSEGHWLFEFESVAASLSSLPSASAKAVRSSGVVNQAAPADLIASSSGLVRELHWSKISSETLQDWLAKAEELLERYSSFNQEY